MKRIIIFAVVAFCVMMTANAQFANKITNAKYIFDKKIPSFIDIEHDDDDGSHKAPNNYSGKAYIEDLLQLNEETTVVLTDTYTDSIGGFHEVYRELYQGIEVEGSKYTLHYDKNGCVYRASGCLWTIEGLNTIPSITEKEALQISLDYVGANKYSWEDSTIERCLKEITEDPNATYYPTGELMVHLKDSIPYLAYKFPISSISPVSSYYVYVDAHCGKPIEKTNSKCSFSAFVLTTHSDAQYIQTSIGSGGYVLKDKTRGLGIETYKYVSSTEVTNYTSTNNIWNLSNYDRVALDVHWGAEKTYDFYLSKFGRNSYDNNGSKLVSHVNDTSIEGAEWHGTTHTLHFGTQWTDENNQTYPPFVSLDVVAHEITHAFTQSTSNLYYANESGSINEGMSDAFAVCVENWAKPGSGDNIWKIGEDVYTIRDLKYPGSDVCIYYQGNNWISSTNNPSDSNDYGGVHTNSGVFGHWFYLLVNGGSGNNEMNDARPVTGIGLEKAMNICYYVNMNKLSQYSNYFFLAESTLEAAYELGYNTNIINQIYNAWYDVGVIISPINNFCYSQLDKKEKISFECKTSNEQLTISLLNSSHKNLMQFTSLSIINATSGEKKWSKKNGCAESYHIHTADWERGVYIIRADQGKEVISKKIVIK